MTATIIHQRRDQIAKSLFDRLTPHCGRRPCVGDTAGECVWLTRPPVDRDRAPLVGDAAEIAGNGLVLSWWRSRGDAAGVTLAFTGVLNGRWVPHAVWIDLFVGADGIVAGVRVLPGVLIDTGARLARMDDELGGLLVRSLMTERSPDARQVLGMIDRARQRAALVA